jgi:hypothetical protein
VSYSNTVLGRYRYEAEGLAKGECGLRIVSEINDAEEVGNWTCVARLQGRKKEGYDFITLTTDGYVKNQQSATRSPANQVNNQPTD